MNFSGAEAGSCEEKKLKVRIEKLVAGGAGLGFSGGPVFIPLTAPGDLVVPSTLTRSRGVAFAQVKELLEAGPERVEPACPWFGRCGGCSWMHLSPDSRLKWKEAIALEAFSRIGKVAQIGFDSVHPSPLETGYRHRARLQVQGGSVGFFRRGTNEVVEWDACLLLPQTLNTAAGVLRGLFRELPPPDGLKWCEGALSPLDGSVTFNWVLDLKKARAGGIPRMMDLLGERLAGRSIRVAGQALSDSKGKVLAARGGSLDLEVAGERLFASPGTFFQVNPAVNRLLVERALGLLEEKGPASLLDLYCGNGNFAVPAAVAGMRVTGVEANPAAAADARKAARGDCHIRTGDAARFLEAGCAGFEAALADPPRTGLPAPAAQALAVNGPATLIYVSCDPVTLARDLASLSRGGYRVERFELFDMFPQTPHAEILAVMGRG